MTKPGPEPGSDGAKRISQAHRGSHDHDTQGGFASKPTLARDAGRKGGETVMKRYGAEYYQNIGKKGGETVRRERGPEYYAEIGRKGGEARSARALAKQMADQQAILPALHRNKNK